MVPSEKTTYKIPCDLVRSHKRVCDHYEIPVLKYPLQKKKKLIWYVKLFYFTDSVGRHLFIQTKTDWTTMVRVT